MGGGIAPTITTPPVLAWTVEIGNTPTLTDPVYTGDPGTITWTLYRDGVADGTIANVSKATAEAYAAVAGDIGPDLHFGATVTNGTGSDSDVTNTVAFDDATYLPNTAIGVSTAGLTLADSDTTVDQWDASLGGVSATLSALTAANRPAYSTGGVGARPLATFDGSTDYLVGTITKGSSFTTIEMGVVGQLGSNSGMAYALNFGTGSNWIRRQDVSPNKIQVRTLASATFATSTSDVNSTPLHFSADSQGANNVRAGGTVEASTASGVTAQGDGSTLALGAFAAGTTPCAMSAQAWYVGPALTADQRTHLRALLTYHTGVAC